MYKCMHLSQKLKSVQKVIKFLSTCLFPQKSVMAGPEVPRCCDPGHSSRWLPWVVRTKLQDLSAATFHGFISQIQK